MNTKCSLIITFILASTPLHGCTRTAKTAEKAPTPVKVEAVQAYTEASGARYSASIVADSQVDLSFNVDGYVDQILRVKGADGRSRNVQQGDRVSQGQVLARVRVKDYDVKVDQASSRLAEMRASLVTTSRQVDEAQVALEKARLDYERAEALFATQSMTKSEYDADKSQYDLLKAKVETAKANLEVVKAQIAAAESNRSAATITRDDTLLRAPLGGLVLERSIEVGNLVKPGDSAFVLADTSVVKAQFGVADLDVASLQPGGTLSVELEALPGRAFTGRVTSISPSADPKTRLFQIEVSIPNPDGALKVGMIASLALGSAPKGDAVAVVPLNAVVRSKDRPDQYAVFVVEDQGGACRVRSRDVTLGAPYGNRIAVQSGVGVGDQVVASGVSSLVDGDPVQVLR